MNRKEFLKYVSIFTIAGCDMNLKEFGNLLESKTEKKMPVAFIGHGNPMFAITENPYKTLWATFANTIPKPTAILCISAHWLTRGTGVTMATNPETIHDFGGFPDELFQVQYPAPGSPTYARMAADAIKSAEVQEDYKWGLDHGTWAVLRNMYPKADIPVFQMSIDYYKSLEFHFKLGEELRSLRSKGVLILGSGNVVHNLRQVRWQENAKPFDWALEFDQFVKNNIEEKNDKALLEYKNLGEIASLAHPTNDHYLPLLYILGLREANDSYSFFNDSIDMGSMSMRSVVFG
ncbi:MAG TPA: 4,5-DOPA dioxygenase extradiol [Leptospiraceae bacterium]|nr:4,5-DOPA dioxygenase extradiol [Leptospiraceae bacterium]HNC56225.1 4,5-DOPA dioxygenase extradiol [Leptospiraceae bacterium]HNF55952.1 4,5-DOPA dioxygenase extradiol [Leptospiraceae bacterium]HNH56234.1 4,5-DOPA dioxygenase extradiol [Leptospiraceae bacterium]HNN79437.1 4,5-DOPA dioxygenase extradiol [Leptospiraceae bacterium]